ncbi:hypothetical protein V1527DRAFT_112447 [Lipomyces starkeyi]
MSNSQSSTMAESSFSSSSSASSPRLHNVDLEKQASELHLDSKPSTTSALNDLESIETIQSLQQRLSPVPSIDVNFPFSTENEEQAVFPEECNIATGAGLVPVATLRSLRNATSETETILGAKQHMSPL